MNSKISVLIAFAASVSVMQGCSHAALDKQIDEKVAQEKEMNTRAELHTETGQLIRTTAGLTADQRAKLGALRETVQTQLTDTQTETMKLRSVLIKDLITTAYNEDEVELIKQRLRNLNEKRLNIVFNAIEQANTILGHDAVSNRDAVDDLLEGRASRTDSPSEKRK